VDVVVVVPGTVDVVVVVPGTVDVVVVVPGTVDVVVVVPGTVDVVVVVPGTVVVGPARAAVARAIEVAAVSITNRTLFIALLPLPLPAHAGERLRGREG
jgi:hypothetical protein